MDGPYDYETLRCVIYCFLVKLTNEKELVTEWMDSRTHGRFNPPTLSIQLSA